MAKHILALRVPDVTNEGIMMIDDISSYAESLPIVCPDLQILPPGAIYPSVLEDMGTNFRLVLNACKMGITGSSDCADTCPTISDGIYNLRYSVSPNDLVYVTYNHLRTTKLMNSLNNLLCNIELPPTIPSKEVVYALQQIEILRNYLIAAKLMVEDQNNPQEGINLYRFVHDRVTKMSKKNPFC